MRDVEKIVMNHLNAWAITDATERASALASVYTEDVRVVEPDGVVRGRSDLNDRIGQLQEHFSGLSFTLKGAIESHHDYAHYQWSQPAEGRSEDVTGYEILHFEGDLIAEAIMFIPVFDELNVPGHEAQTDS